MITLLTLGFLIGVTHAFEADHLAAVSALVAGKSKRSAIVQHGAIWGAGHTITLFLVGGVVLFSGIGLNETVSLGIESLVGLMLVALGAHVLFRLWRDRVHFHRHNHNDGTSHFHLHSHKGETRAHDASKHAHNHHDRAAKRTLAVGIMHGAAGSAALVLAAAASMDSALSGLAYILTFGVGSLVGMVGMSVIIALPLALTAKTLTRFNTALQIAIGSLTIAVGSWTLSENLTQIL